MTIILDGKTIDVSFDDGHLVLEVEGKIIYFNLGNILIILFMYFIFCSVLF